MAITLAIVNQKGGTGKTTSAIEIAACLKNKKKKVLVIDLDQQTNLTRDIGGDPFSDGIYDVLVDDKDIMSCIQKNPEFDLLSSSEQLSKVPGLLSDAADVVRLKEVLEPVQDKYNYIVCDCSPARDLLLNMAYVAADYLIIPAEAEKGSILGIEAVFNDLKKYRKAKLSGAEILGVILTKYERTGMHKFGEEQIRAVLDREESTAFLMQVRKSIAANETKEEGGSLQTGKKNTNPAKDYRDITDEIIRRTK